MKKTLDFSKNIVIKVIKKTTTLKGLYTFEEIKKLKALSQKLKMSE